VPGGTDHDERLVRYLLGELSEQERDQLESEYLGNSESHDQLVAAEDELIYAYVGGRLSHSQSISFERFFLQTPERRSRVEFARSFAHFLDANPGLQRAPAQDRERAGTPPIQQSFWTSVVAWGKNPLVRLAFATLIVAIFLVSFLRTRSMGPAKLAQNKSDAVIKNAQPSKLAPLPDSANSPADRGSHTAPKTLASKTENPAAYELYRKGQSLLQIGRRDEKTLNEALDLFESATQKDARFALAYIGTADAALKLYDNSKDGARIEQALAAANRAKSLNDNLPEVHSILGSVYTATGRNAEAVAELKRAVELAPNSDEGYRRLGNVYLKTGQKAEAVKTLQQAVDANPYYWPNHYSLGTAYYQFGDNAQALKAFQRATELEPNNATIWTTIGATQYRQSNWNESIAAFKKALELKPSELIYSNLGTSYFFLGHYDEARANFEKAVDMRPQDPYLVGNLADCYHLLGQRDKANAAYDRAISLAFQSLQTNPRDAGALSNLGLFYAKKGDTGKGLEFIRRAREVDPADNTFLYKEVVINTLANRMPEALHSLQEALSKGYLVKEAFADPNLKTLRQRPEFLPMMKQFEPLMKPAVVVPTTVTHAMTAEDWDKPWKKDDVWYTRQGGDFVLYKITPTTGTFIFSISPRDSKGVFDPPKVRWVINYLDPKNYIEFEIDKQAFASAEYRNGEKIDHAKRKPHGVESSNFVIQMRIDPGQVMVQIRSGDDWEPLDQWNEPGHNYAAGRFGFRIPDQDQMYLTDFRFTQRAGNR
jgi:tetratricopeptide (TPR) repeat protein